MRVTDCSVALVSDESAAFAGDPERIYRVGSLTKLAMELSIRHLAAEGLLDLDAPVASMIKMRLPDGARAVTLRQLLEHRSGLPREFLWFVRPYDFHQAMMCGLVGSHIYADFESREGFEATLNAWPFAESFKRPRCCYSNVGFALLMMAVSDHLGLSEDEILNAGLKLKTPLPSTGFTLSEKQIARLTEPQAGKLPWLKRRGSPVDPHPLGPALRGVGALYSSVADCAEILRAYRREVLEPLLKTMDLDALPSEADCGMLKVHIAPSGHRLLYRFGFVYGGQTFVCFDTRSDRFLLIFRNVTSWPAAEDLKAAEDILAVSITP